MENEFTKYLMSKIGEIKAQPKRLLGGMAEPVSWYFNRAPDQADIFSKPGIRNKINAAVGTGLVEVANAGKDAIEEGVINSLALLGAPESGGTTLPAALPKWVNPVKGTVNFLTDYLMDDFVNPMLYDLADKDINLGGRLPQAPSWYKGSQAQKVVNQADKKVTDFATWVANTHPQTQIMAKAKDVGAKHGKALHKAKEKITQIR